MCDTVYMLRKENRVDTLRVLAKLSLCDIEMGSNNINIGPKI